jgi:hypothetical protein
VDGQILRFVRAANEVAGAQADRFPGWREMSAGGRKISSSKWQWGIRVLQEAGVVGTEPGKETYIWGYNMVELEQMIEEGRLILRGDAYVAPYPTRGVEVGKDG